MDDGGRSTDTKRRPHTADCMIRALVCATGLPYAQVYDEMIEEGVFSPKSGGFLDRLIGQLAFEERDYHGFKFEWIPFQAKKGVPRMNPDKFAEQFPTGNFILRMGHHYCSMINGVLRDCFVHTDMRCVYGAWRITQQGR